MKLSVFNNENFPKSSYRSGGPKIGFAAKGQLSINYFAAELIGIKHGDKVSLAQDESDPENWYIFKDKDGFEVRLHSDKKTLITNHSKLCDSLKESLGLDASTSQRFTVGGQPTILDKVKYWGLIYIAKN
jgi:hypothetical protein